MRVAILHDQITDSSRKDETDALVQARTVAAALDILGHEWMTLGVSLDLDVVQSALRQMQPDLCFNLVEALGGHGRLIHVIPGLLDAMRIPYTGVSAEAQFLTSNKLTAKQIMRGAGIPTPGWFTPGQLNESIEITADQYIIKSVWEHASVGLDEDSIVDVANAPDPRLRLRAALETRLEQLGGNAFAERYIDGREFNLALLLRRSYAALLNRHVFSIGVRDCNGSTLHFDLLFRRFQVGLGGIITRSRLIQLLLRRNSLLS